MSDDPVDDKLSVLQEEGTDPETWRVENIDADSGACEITIFSGPNAEARAIRFAEWEYGYIPF